MISRLTYIFCAIFLLYASFVFYPKWQQPSGEAAISYDAAGYYWYLPSAVIYKDLKLQSFKDTVLQKYMPIPPNDFQFAFKTENGNYVMKYSSGMALMELPFFTVAHILARPLGYPADGFSPPYQLAIQIGGVLMALLGLWFFRRLLLLYYDDKVTAFSILLLVIGTNYLDFAGINIGMSHSWLFTLYVFLLFATHNFYKTNGYRSAVVIGLLIGLLTLSRPTEIIACLLPILWGMDGISLYSLQQKAKFLTRVWKQLALAAICTGFIISIQLFYWKYASGHWLVYSYQGQGFSWSHPHFFDYTFHYATGWLMYTPIMLLAFIGIIPFLIKGRNKVAILVFFAINYYIVCAWNVWNYGGRAMVQSYPILFFPVASLLQTIMNTRVLKWIATPIIILFVYVNLWTTWFAHRGHDNLMQFSDFNSAPYYWHTIGRWSTTADMQRFRDNMDYFEGTRHDMQLIYTNGFETDSTYGQTPITGKGSLCLNENLKESPHYQIPPHTGNGHWLHASVILKCMPKEYEPWRMTQFVVCFSNHGQIVKERFSRMQRFADENKPTEVYIDVAIPSKAYDKIEVFFINSYSDKSILLDDLKVGRFNAD